MVKKKNWLVLGISIPVLITVALLVIMLAIGGSGGSGTDSSGIPFVSFFVIFILPSIITHQKKRREQKEMQLKN